MATAPSSEALWDARDPLNEPIGVLTALTMKADFNLNQSIV